MCTSRSMRQWWGLTRTTRTGRRLGGAATSSRLPAERCPAATCLGAGTMCTSGLARQRPGRQSLQVRVRSPLVADRRWRQCVPRARVAHGRSSDLFPFAGLTLPGGGLSGRGGNVFLGAGEAIDVGGPGQWATVRLRAAPAAAAYSSPPMLERLRRSTGMYRVGSEVLLWVGAGTKEVMCQAVNLFAFAGTEATCTSGPGEVTGARAMVRPSPL